MAESIHLIITPPITKTHAPLAQRVGEARAGEDPAEFQQGLDGAPLLLPLEGVRGPLRHEPRRAPAELQRDGLLRLRRSWLCG